MNLEKGFHRLKLKYFEDCEGQRLDFSVITPDGHKGSLPSERLYIPVD